MHAALVRVPASRLLCTHTYTHIYKYNVRDRMQRSIPYWIVATNSLSDGEISTNCGGSGANPAVPRKYKVGISKLGASGIWVGLHPIAGFGGASEVPQS